MNILWEPFKHAIKNLPSCSFEEFSHHKKLLNLFVCIVIKRYAWYLLKVSQCVAFSQNYFVTAVDQVFFILSKHFLKLSAVSWNFQKLLREKKEIFQYLNGLKSEHEQIFYCYLFGCQAKQIDQVGNFLIYWAASFSQDLNNNKRIENRSYIYIFFSRDLLGQSSKFTATHSLTKWL